MSELLEEALAALQKYRAQMDKDKLEIESNQARTWAILAELQKKRRLNLNNER